MSPGRPTPPPLRSLVVAGGASTRMGTDKALLLYGGESQVRRIARLLERVAPPVCVSVRASQAAHRALEGLRLLVDPVEDSGPVEGLLAAFGEAPECAWLAVAVDMPLLTEATLRNLIASRDPEAYATAFLNREIDGPEPLCTIWEPAAAVILERRKREGRRSLMVLRDLRVRLVEPPDPAELENVNDPEAYRRAASRLEPASGP